MFDVPYLLVPVDPERTASAVSARSGGRGVRGAQGGLRGTGGGHLGGQGEYKFEGTDNLKAHHVVLLISLGLEGHPVVELLQALQDGEVSGEV